MFGSPDQRRLPRAAALCRNPKFNDLQGRWVGPSPNKGLLQSEWVILRILDRREHASGERHLVLWLAVGGDPIPVSINHLSKLLVGFQALPLQAGAPVLDEAPRPAFALVVPELTEGLLEQVAR